MIYIECVIAHKADLCVCVFFVNLWLVLFFFFAQRTNVTYQSSLVFFFSKTLKAIRMCAGVFFFCNLKE